MLLATARVKKEVVVPITSLAEALRIKELHEDGGAGKGVEPETGRSLESCSTKRAKMGVNWESTAYGSQKNGASKMKGTVPPQDDLGPLTGKGCRDLL